MKIVALAAAAAIAFSLAPTGAAAKCQAVGQITRALVTNGRGGEFWVRPSNRVANTVKFGVIDAGTMSAVLVAQANHLRIEAVGLTVNDICGPALSGLVEGGTLHYFVASPEE